MPAELKAVAGLVFDLDGTLIDSTLDFAAIRAEIACPDGTGLLEFLDGLADPAQRAKAEAVIVRHELRAATSATWMEGARELVEAWRGSGRPAGIVTRNSREAAEMILSGLDIDGIKLVTRHDAPPKPDPAGLLQLAELWQIDPGSMLYVGDYVFDVQAANRAGMLSCLYMGSGRSDGADQADLVIHHFDELRMLLLPSR